MYVSEHDQCNCESCQTKISPTSHCRQYAQTTQSEFMWEQHVDANITIVQAAQKQKTL